MKNISTIKKPKMAIPLKVHTSISCIPDKITMNNLEKLATDNRLFSHIAVLSDAHQKKDIGSPTGTTLASEDHIIPQLFDSAPNCGMRVIATNLKDEDVTPDKIDALYKNLIKSIPTKKYFGTRVPLRIAIRSFLNGSKPLAEYLNVRTKNEIINTYEQGDVFNSVPSSYRIKSVRELFSILPPFIIYLSRYRLGLLGGTKSHYLSLMKVDEIINKKHAELLGLKQGQYVFFMHTGSGIIGRYIGYLYSPQKRRLREKIEFTIIKLGYFSKSYRKVKKKMKEAIANRELVGYNSSSKAGKMAVKGLLAAGNQGFANRTMLTHLLDESLEKFYGRQIALELVYDTPHILFSKEHHKNKQVWVYRNGSSRAHGPSQFKHDIFSQTGEPCFIGPFEQTFAYVGTGTDTKNETFSSANHELGKKEYIADECYKLLPKNRVFRKHTIPIYTNSKNFTLESEPRFHKYTNAVVNELESFGVMNLTVRMLPLAVLTYRKKL